MTTATFTVLLLSHLFQKNPTTSDSSALFAWWKVASYMFQTICMLNMGISIIFWTVLWPNMPHESPKNLDGLLTLLDHTAPLTLTLIEWCLNGIRFELRHLLPQLLMIVSYGALNLTWTKVTGTSVYPVITWDTPAAWASGIAVIPFFMLLFVL
jgi:uncharacterized membrane protein YwaF